MPLPWAGTGCSSEYTSVQLPPSSTSSSQLAPKTALWPQALGICLPEDPPLCLQLEGHKSHLSASLTSLLESHQTQGHHYDDNIQGPIWEETTNLRLKSVGGS